MEGTTVYLDNAAGTRLDERVLEAMKPYMFETYAVATSEFGYSMGTEAREALDRARAGIAASMGAATEEFVFTSGGTESDNLAIKGVLRAAKRGSAAHVITTAIEDFPVLNSVAALEKEGIRTTLLPVDGDGLLDPGRLRDAITDDTVLVSVQHANQEIGTVQDIAAMGAICRERGVLFHSDATHSFTRIGIDVREVPVDLVTVSAHTIHGPHGVGGLYVRTGVKIAKIMDGGFQEFNLRPGVENIPGAVGFARAVSLVTGEENDRLRGLRDTIIDRALADIPRTTLNGHRTRRVPQNANITFHAVEGESITLHLDMRGYAVSTGSACFSRSLQASHVILGIGGDHERAHGSVRFSLGRFNTAKEVEGVLAAVAEIIRELRSFSPLA